MRRNFESLNFERPQEAPTRHSLSYKDTDEDEFVDELSQFVPSSPTRLIRNQKACNPNNRLPSSCFRRNLTTSPHTFRKRFSWFLAVFLIVCLIAVVLFNFISMGKLQNVCLEQNNAEPVSNSQLMETDNDEYNPFHRKGSVSQRAVYLLGGNGNLVSKQLSSSFPDQADVHWIGSDDIESFCLFLSKATNIHSLHIDNVESGSELFDPTLSPLNMKSLKALTLQKVSPAFTVLKLLATKAFMENLQILRLDETSIDNAEDYVTKILNSCRYSLKNILFPGYRWQTSFLQDTETSFPSVQEIHLDVTDYNEVSGNHIPSNLCSRIPKLEKFTSKLGSFAIEDIMNLSSCKRLKSIEIGIYVTRRKTVADLRFLTQMLSLKRVHLRMYFHPVPGGGRSCDILNEEQLHAKFRSNLTILKKC